MVKKSSLTALILGGIVLGLSSTNLYFSPTQSSLSTTQASQSCSKPSTQPIKDNYLPLPSDPDDRIAKEERVKNLEARGYYFHRQ